MMSWLPPGVSTYSGQIDSLFYLIYYITTVTFFVVQITLLVFVFSVQDEISVIPQRRLIIASTTILYMATARMMCSAGARRTGPTPKFRFRPAPITPLPMMSPSLRPAPLIIRMFQAR